MPPINPQRIYDFPSLSAQQIPFYALTFDKAGTCTSPATCDAVIDRVAAEGYSDVILFSHGWNNDWEDANAVYHRFLTETAAIADAHSGPPPVMRKILYLGMIWPSAAFVWPWEDGPDIAATDDTVTVDDVAILSEDLPEAAAQQLAQLSAGPDMIDAATLHDLAALLLPALAPAEADDDSGNGTTAQDLADSLAQGSATAAAPAPVTGGFDSGGVAGGGLVGEVKPAGLSDLFGIRKALRLATVLKMKDRAGVVGRRGVAETLGRLLAETPARVHLVGHSYGAKVVLSALSHAPGPRKAQSALVLQPAINRFAFSADVLGRPGGLRPALTRVERPILATHSVHDFPLRHAFHLAVNRRKDIGEVDIAGVFDAYHAMGGYGVAAPAAGEMDAIDLPAPGNGYPGSAATVRVRSLDGRSGISGHADVANPHTAWAMLHNLA